MNKGLRGSLSGRALLWSRAPSYVNFESLHNFWHTAMPSKALKLQLSKKDPLPSFTSCHISVTFSIIALNSESFTF